MSMFVNEKHVAMADGICRFTKGDHCLKSKVNEFEVCFLFEILHMTKSGRGELSAQEMQSCLIFFLFYNYLSKE